MNVAPSVKRHALVVGGTGMLREVVRWLAGEGWAVSVIARGRDRLATLEEETVPSRGSVQPLPVDYRDDETLYAALTSVIKRKGPIELAVCWIHSTAPRALGTIAAVLGAQPMPSQLLRVRGSVSRDPSIPDRDDIHLLNASSRLEYRRVILGFEVDGSGPRWLTDAEIASGVIEAIVGKESLTVVGTVRPWSARP